MAELGLSAEIECNLSPEAVRDRLARAAICVMPSRAPEGFGRVAIEALSCGARLIATRVGALPDTAGEHARFVERADPAPLAAAIRAEMAAPASSRAIEAARRHVRERYDLASVAQRMDDLLEQAARRS